MFTQIAFSQRLISHPRLCFPAISSLGFREFPVRIKGFRREVVHFDTFSKKGRFCSDILVGRRRRGSGSWCCWVKGFEESEGEAILEAEIFEFMNKSEKPEAFPTKEELVKSGRMDLVEAIVKKGGWLSMGWDLDDDVDEKEGFSGDYWETADFSIEDFQERVESLQENSSFKEPEAESLHSSPLASPSGRSLDMAVEDISGIDGILNRLEKDRNVALGINLGSNGHTRNASNESDRDHTHIHNLADANRAALRENCTPTPPTDMWRTWSSQRAGFRNTEFEAAEIYYDQDTTGWENGNSHNERKFTKGASEAVDILNEINRNHIQIRLQQMELELASTLHSLRSTRKEALPKGHASSELQKLSDEWEFQENEVINTKDKLRSIRAKLAILEGKMALAIIQSQKILEEKEVRIAGARRSLRLLQTCCIVWPSTASDVLLTGSFDGWTTQRKMEKSKTGIFSVCLQLYPGRYEIKFIVDGVWKIDPLRPIVHNSGHENNLLIIT